MGGSDRFDTGLDIDMIEGRVTELIDRGVDRYTRGDLEGALGEWQHALALDPDCGRAQDFSDYVREHLSALAHRYESTGSLPDIVEELERSPSTRSTIEMAPSDEEPRTGYNDQVFVAHGEDEVTSPFRESFSEKETRELRLPHSGDGEPVETVSSEDESSDFDDQETVKREAVTSQPASVDDGWLDDGWDFDAAPTTMYDPAKGRGAASGEVSSETETVRDERDEPRTKGPTIELSPELAAVASHSEPESAEDGIAAALDAVAEGLEAIDLTDVQHEPSAPLSLGLPTDAASDLKSTQADEGDQTVQRQLGDYPGLDQGEEFDREMGSVVDQPTRRETARDSDEPVPDIGDFGASVPVEQVDVPDLSQYGEEEDDDREPLSITIEAEDPADYAYNPPRTRRMPEFTPLPMGYDDDEDLMPEVTIERGEDLELDDSAALPAPEGQAGPVNLGVDMGHLEDIGESVRDGQAGIHPGQQVVLGSGQQPSAVEISLRSSDAGQADSEQREQRPPTQDPTISEASIDLDDSLLSFEQPTREHDGVADIIDAIDSEPDLSLADDSTLRETRELKPIDTEVRTREFGRAAPLAGSYEEIAGAMLDAIEATAQTAESDDERIRRRVGGLIARAENELRDNQSERAVIAVDLALQEAPESAVAQKLIHGQSDLLLEVYRSYLGVLTNVPALAIPMESLQLQELDHRAAFLVSRIDGALTFEDILDVSGMPRLEALRHLSKLLLQGVLEIR